MSLPQPYPSAVYDRDVAEPLEDSLVSGFTRLAAETPRRRIDIELRVLDTLLAVLFGVLGLSVAASGQSLLTEDDVPAAVGRFVNGPMNWTPTLTLRDAGVDTNIFAVPTNEKRDTTASVMPSVDSRLALGSVRAHSKGHLEYLYFERYAQERAVNGQVETRLEMPDRRIRPLVRDELSAREARRLSQELDQLARLLGLD